ncbi:MAG: tetratricopeptide repeat protein [Ardenticatenaceae bacterium]|nr:tetratricopeptide repeat protein [Ardenticatenaceae bacterium]
MEEEPAASHFHDQVVGSAVGGGSVTARNIAGGDIHEHIHIPREVTFPVVNLPPRNPHFVGRAAHLQTLTAALRPAPHPQAPTPDPQPLTITQTISGLGGVGKSQLMLHFAHTQRAQYDVIWWLRVDEALTEDFLALGRQVGLAVEALEQAAAVQMVRAWLSSSDKRWLLLCDNADTMEPRDLRAWLPAGPQGRILITSRSPRWDAVGAVLRLDVFTAAEAGDFWRKRMELELELEEERTLAELAMELGYLPLALAQAAAYAAENGLDAAGYLDLYRARRRELWARQPAPDDYHATITTTWEIGFAAARQTAGAADLLNLCCFLAPDDIPLDLLVDHADSLPEELAAVLADPLARHDALRALERYALLTRADGALSVHRLVQAVARDQMGEARAKAWVEAAVGLLYQAYDFDKQDMTTWVKCGQLMPHLAAATDLAAEWGIESNRAAFLNNEAGFYLNHYGNLAEARPYFERALAIDEKALGPDHPDTAIDLNNLGLLLKTMGDLAGARPYHERALAIREKALGPDHPDTATSLNNLGGLLQAIGNLAEARPYYESALAINEKALGPDHPDTAQSLNNLGYLLQAMGNLAGARPYYERALAIREKALGPDHPDTANSLNNLGISCERWAIWRRHGRTTNAPWPSGKKRSAPTTPTPPPASTTWAISCKRWGIWRRHGRITNAPWPLMKKRSAPTTPTPPAASTTWAVSCKRWGIWRRHGRTTNAPWPSTKKRSAPTTLPRPSASTTWAISCKRWGIWRRHGRTSNAPWPSWKNRWEPITPTPKSYAAI